MQQGWPDQPASDSATTESAPLHPFIHLGRGIQVQNHPALFDIGDNCKRCYVCKNVLPVSAFHRSKTSQDGCASMCKGCMKEYRLEHYRRRKENGEERAFNQSRRRYLKSLNLQYNFGITVEDYEAMLQAQQGACAICKKPETSTNKFGKPRDLAVDHDHRSGKVRGLLCCQCNQGLGAFQDCPELLSKAIVYLQER
jgi:hypothetical protein